MFTRHAVLVVGCLLCLCRAEASAQVDKATARWAETIVLAGNTYRWTKENPTLSVFGGTPTEQSYVADIVEHVNETLKHTPIKSIHHVNAGTATADIRIYLLKYKEMPAVSKKLGFEYMPGNAYLFQFSWDRQRAMNKAYVLIATDKMNVKQLQHVLIKEIAQALGLISESSEFKDSIFYTDGGTAVKLSDRDRKLIRFFYNHVPPGSDAAALRAALKEHWKGS